MLKKLVEKLKGQRVAPEKQASRNARSSRLPVQPLHDIAFERGQLRLKVWNISTTGVGLEFHPDLLVQGTASISAKGAMVEGLLRFPQGRDFPVRLRGVHCTGAVMGCAFVGDVGTLRGAVEAYFDIELSALELMRVNPEVLKEEPDGKPTLYRGKHNGELFFVEREGAIVRFQVSFCGNYIEGDEKPDSRFGYLAAEGRQGAKYKGASLVRWVSEPPPELRQNAVRFIEHVPGLLSEQRKFITARIASER